MVGKSDCPHCSTRPETDAEYLLSVARSLRAQPRRLVVAEGGIDAEYLACVRVALDLADRPGLTLRAIVEGWDRVRINRELY